MMIATPPTVVVPSPTSLMMMVPSIASWRSCRVLRTSEITFCMRSISCLKNIFIDDNAPIFCSLALICQGGDVCPHVGGGGGGLLIVAYLMGDIVTWKLLQHVCGHLVHLALPGLPPATTAILGLYAHDGLQHLLYHVALEPVEVWSGVEPSEVDMRSHVMSALECNPNTSGVSTGGRCSMASRNCSIYRAGGIS